MRRTRFNDSHARPWTWAVVLISLLIGGCAAGVDDEGRATEGTSNPIVYGEDNRLDLYAHPGADWRALVRESIAVMVPTYTLNRSGGLNTSSSGTLGQSQRLCSGERFADQPSVGLCSGTLIDDDLILTAGHCIDSRTCSDHAWAFDYYYEANGRLAESGPEDVYRCQAVERHVLENSGVDYAIVRLDRPVTGDRKPAKIRRTPSALAVGAPVTLVGFPSGIPAKIAGGGHVSNARARTLDYFEANVDAFGGNSGSGVFNDAGELVGVLVRGAQDYRYRSGCYVVNTVREETDDGEDITYVQNALRDACETGSILSNAFCYGDNGEEVDAWCRECRTDYDCVDGFVCGDGACTKTCFDDGDCRDDHSCQNNACVPDVTRACAQGDVWGTDACGRPTGRIQDCADHELCSDGACVTYDEGNTCGTAHQIALNDGRIEGAFDNATHTLEGTCGGAGPEHVYSFTVDRPATVKATATGNFDTVLYLQEGCAGEEIACNDDATPPGGRGSSLTAALQPGEYSLIIDAYAQEATGNYQIQLEVTWDEGDVCEPACALGARRCQGSGVQACVEVDGCAAWGAVTRCEDGCEDGACLEPEPEPEPEGEGDTCQDARVIQPVSQRLSGDLRDFNADDTGTCGGRGAEIFLRFNLDEPMLFDATVSGFDSVIYLLEGCGAELECNDDATPPGNYGSNFLVPLEPGAYTLVIDSYGQAGAFEADLQFVPNDYTCEDVCDGECVDGECVEITGGDGDTCDTAMVIPAASQTLQGDLANFDADLRGSCGGNGADQVFSFTLERPATLTATSTGLDTVLYLSTACGQADAELICNDDSTPPGNYGSRLTSQLEAGTYFLVLDAYRAAGAYTLDLVFD